MITSKDIQSFILKHWLIEHHNPYTVANFSSGGYEEADVMAISKAGVVTEFEIKMSRSDFFQDFKKTKHRYFENANDRVGDLSTLFHKIPNKFYFAVPKGLIKAQEVPEYAGLIYFTKFELKGHKQPYIEFEYIRKAPYIHRGKPEETIYKQIANVLSQRMILGCALMTYQNRETRARNKEMKEVEKRIPSYNQLAQLPGAMQANTIKGEWKVEPTDPLKDDLGNRILPKGFDRKIKQGLGL